MMSGSGQVLFLFPGQGAQRQGMLADLVGVPNARDLIDALDDITGQPVSSWLDSDPDKNLTRTEIAQPAILVTGFLAAQAAIASGIRPQAMAGHSLGELTALAVAGALDPIDAIRLTHFRGTAMQRAVGDRETAMVALIGGSVESIQSVIGMASGRGLVEIANINAPGQVVISGDRAAVDWVADTARSDSGIRKAIRLQVSAPFHCRLMQPAADELAGFLASVPISVPDVPVWSNADLRHHSPDTDEIRAALVRQVTAPVDWVRQTELMAAESPAAVELAPAGVLAGLCSRINRDWPIRQLASLQDIQAQVGL